MTITKKRTKAARLNHIFLLAGLSCLLSDVARIMDQAALAAQRHARGEEGRP